MKQEAKKPKQQVGKDVLTQDQLKAWWPFTRLDPSRMPKQPKPEYEECLL